VGYGSSYAEDELADGADTARLFSSKHTSISISKSIFCEELPKIVSALEEPIATSSVVPMYFVCQRARQDVKVALVGQGPDELFGGYRRHLGVRYGALWTHLPSWIRASISSAIAALPRNETLKRGIYSLAVKDRMRRYQHVLSILPGAQVEELFQDGVLPPNSGDTIVDCWSNLASLMTETDELGGLQFLEVRSTLPDELLMYADKLSMAHGLELRVPFVDKEIVEYVERLPAKLKVRNGSGKWLHRQVCRTYLPESLLRRPKRAFASDVVDDWFRDAMDSKMADTLLDPESRIYQFLLPSPVRKLFEQHASGQEDNHKILFSLVLFEEWLRIHESPVATFI
jgi:asparagine synthase (glutamine-hydrolysing)